MRSKKLYFKNEDGSKVRVTIAQSKKIHLCQNISAKLNVSLVHVGGMNFILKDKNGNSVGMKNSKSLEGMRKFLLKHENDGELISKELLKEVK
jgi:hypothetical protein